MDHEPIGFDRWHKGAEKFLAAKPTPNADDIAHLVQDEVTYLAVSIEKELCTLLDWEWRPLISIQTCLDALKEKLSK